MDQKTITTVERMAKRGTLEVEHLLRVARKPSPELADALDELAITMGWVLDSRFPEVPFGMWIQTISLYCRKGYAGLIEAGRSLETLPFVLGILEDLRTEEALRSVVLIAALNHRWPSTNPKVTQHIAGALNIAALHVRDLRLPQVERAKGRDFLHAAFAATASDNERGTILCALRYFGDETTLPFIAASPPMSAEWEAARTAATRAIKKTMKAQAAST